jgi:hypothetical protein
MLGVDVELHILSFSDVKTLVSFSYCDKERYRLVNNTEWLWEMFTLDFVNNKDHNLVHDNWKYEYIRCQHSFNETMIVPECLSWHHFHFKNNYKTVSRVNYSGIFLSHAYETVFAYRLIKPNTITYLEFKIDCFTPSFYGSEVVVGCCSEEFGTFSGVSDQNFGHSAEKHFAFGFNGSNHTIVHGKQSSKRYAMDSTTTYYRLICSVKSGSTIGFLINNGVIDQNKAHVTLFLDGVEMDTIARNLPVMNYRPCVSMCPEIEVSISKFARRNIFLDDPFER